MSRIALVILLAFLEGKEAPVKKNRPLNRLANEKSPYLKQHETNPVDWYPWGKEAFAKAKKENKPIFLSIGYSSCHWCHVMEHESFDDEEVAAYLNKHFVSIKLDREERPDIDAVYMKALTEVLGRQGGWPLSIWMTPEGKPFVGGTYYPKTQFLDLLERIHMAWADDEVRAKVLADGDNIVKHLQERYTPEAAEEFSPQLLELARHAAERHSDRVHGGFGEEPKFPNPSAVELMLRYHLRHDDKEALVVAELALTKMALGGIHDHVGGGFHRYSVTRDWLVPHFEKMLYDNGQLLELYAWAYAITGKSIYRETALDIGRWVQREMTGPEGGFYSAQDADDPGGPEHEGGFYIWSPDEVKALLPKEQAEAVLARFDITEKGNWDHRPGKSILQVRPQAPDADVGAALDTMYAAREKRPKPMTDTKVLAGWNGLMITGFCASWQMLGEKSHLESAVRAGEFVREHMWKDGRLKRRWAEGEAAHDAVLDDYAWTVRAWLDLYESTFDESWLRDAIALQAKADELFFDGAAGGYFYTAKDGEALIARGKDAFDHARPSGNGVMAQNLMRLMHLTGNLAYRERAQRTVAAFGGTAGRALFYYGALFNAVDYAADDTREIFVADGEGFDALVTAVWRSPRRNRVIAKVTPALTKLAPPAEGKVAVDGKAAAYVCRNFTCKAPTTDPAQLR
ncbi:MAG: thioredoxin domain-containing protein [Planctomycetota bacterium]